MGRVVRRLPGRVGPGDRGVGLDAHSPSKGLFDPVVAPAEAHQVGRAGGPRRPRPDVVEVAEDRAHGAPGEPAPPVSRLDQLDQCSAAVGRPAIAVARALRGRPSSPHGKQGAGVAHDRRTTWREWPVARRWLPSVAPSVGGVGRAPARPRWRRLSPPVLSPRPAPRSDAIGSSRPRHEQAQPAGHWQRRSIGDRHGQARAGAAALRDRRCLGAERVPSTGSTTGGSRTSARPRPASSTGRDGELDDEGAGGAGVDQVHQRVGPGLVHPGGPPLLHVLPGQLVDDGPTTAGLLDREAPQPGVHPGLVTGPPSQAAGGPRPGCLWPGPARRPRHRAHASHPAAQRSRRLRSQPSPRSCHDLAAHLRGRLAQLLADDPGAVAVQPTSSHRVEDCRAPASPPRRPRSSDCSLPRR